MSPLRGPQGEEVGRVGIQNVVAWKKWPGGRPIKSRTVKNSRYQLDHAITRQQTEKGETDVQKRKRRTDSNNVADARQVLRAVQSLKLRSRPRAIFPTLPSPPPHERDQQLRCVCKVASQPRAPPARQVRVVLRLGPSYGVPATRDFCGRLYSIGSRSRVSLIIVKSHIVSVFRRRSTTAGAARGRHIDAALSLRFKKTID